MKLARTKDTPAFCPSSAFIDAQKTKGPESKSFEDFKIWAGKIKANEAVTVEAYRDLYECWEFYHEKRELQASSKILK
jgi:hypothetical protein